MGKFSGMARGAQKAFGKTVGATAGAAESTKMRIKANEPLNRVFQGVKNAGTQTKQAYRGQVPLTTPLRKGDAIASMRASKQGAEYEWGDGSLSWKKVGLAAAGGYAAIDSVNRMESGGSVTRNAEGQRDIVGIPII